MSSADTGAAAASAECPECGGDIEFDPVQALTFCLDCGVVLSNENLDISVLFEEDGQRSGVRVAANDDGTSAAIGGLPAGARGFGRAGLKASQARVQARARVLCGTMGLPAAVQADALSLAEDLLVKLYERGDRRIASRDRVAASVLIIAARQNQLPITAVEIAIASKVSTKALGRSFCSAVELLGLSLPHTPPHVFLRAATQKACRNKEIQADVEREATTLEAWLREQLHLQASPPLKCAAALTISLEAHGAKAKDVSRVMHVSDKHLKNYLSKVRQSLVQAAQALPWASSISTKNVALHLETILKIIRLGQRVPDTDSGA